MAITQQHVFIENEFEEREEGSDSDEYDSEDSEKDPSYSILQDFPTKFSELSIKKKLKSGINPGSESDPDEGEVSVPILDEKDEKSFEKIQKIIEAGQIEKLKADQCKVYLRKYGLRLTGNKNILIQRIKEHIDIVNGGGEKKYPMSGFVLNCKGDACTGDVVMFEQNVYEMFNLASRSASGPPCGTRIIAGRIVKESYGAAKQQHTFTIEVLWSKGEKPLPPLHPLLIKGRNLYRLKTLRQRWEDERQRQKVLMEKHLRGSLARSDREARIEEKEMRKKLKANRISRMEEPNKKQSRLKSNPRVEQPIQSQQTGSGKVANQFHQSSHSLASGKLARATQQSSSSVNSGKLAIQPQHSGVSVNYAEMETQHKPQKDQILQRIRSSIEEEVRHQRCNEFYADYNLNLHNHRSHSNGYPHSNGFSERASYRQPLRSINHFLPMNPPERQGHTFRQPCRYYAQGRCHFGDNCKFLHQLRDDCIHRREETWHHGQNKLERHLY